MSLIFFHVICLLLLWYSHLLHRISQSMIFTYYGELCPSTVKWFWRRNTCRNYNCGWIIMQFLSSPLGKISLLLRTSLCQTKLFRSICSCFLRWMLHSSSELRKLLFCVVASCLVRNCFQVQQSVTFPCNFPTSFHGYVSFAIHLTFFM